MSTRADNVNGELFQHYKPNGGRYRRLFQAMFVPSTHWAANKHEDHDILHVLHSDDARSLRVVMTSSGPFVIDTRPGTSLGPQHYYSYSPYEVIGPMTVYVSLTYGTLWGRMRTEFDGTTEDGSIRFGLVTATGDRGHDLD
jgi:hypothetical protein